MKQKTYKKKPPHKNRIVEIDFDKDAENAYLIITRVTPDSPDTNPTKEQRRVRSYGHTWNGERKITPASIKRIMGMWENPWMNLRGLNTAHISEAYRYE